MTWCSRYLGRLGRRPHIGVSHMEKEAGQLIDSISFQEKARLLRFAGYIALSRLIQVEKSGCLSMLLSSSVHCPSSLFVSLLVKKEKLVPGSVGATS
jgi:hypothetical protein